MKKSMFEVGTDGFKTPSRCKPFPQLCVSARISEDKVQVRDTKDPTKTTLTFDHAEWKTFIDGVKAGEFDV